MKHGNRLEDLQNMKAPRDLKPAHAWRRRKCGKAWDRRGGSRSVGA